MPSTKQILVGAGLIGASIFILPSLIGGRSQTQGGGGGGGVQSVGAIGLPSGLSSSDGSTKKDGTTTTIYQFPDAPDLNITESSDLGISDYSSSTKKEDSVADIPTAPSFESGESFDVGGVTFTPAGSTTKPKKVVVRVTPPITTALTNEIHTEKLSTGGALMFRTITSPKYIVAPIVNFFKGLF